MSLRSAVASALLAVACAHAHPQDAAGQRDVADSDDGDRHVSARAYHHYLDALLAKNDDDFGRAAAELQKALLYDPESPHLHTVLGEVLLRQGHVAEAEDELRAAIGIDPDHAPALLLLGRIAVAREKPEQARAYLQSAIRAAPRDPDAWRELVRLDIALDDVDRAEQTAGRLARVCAEAQPRNTGGASGEALVTAERLREQAASAWLEVARARVQHHDDAGAERAFSQARSTLPSDPDVLAAEASWLESRRHVDEARQLWLRVLAQRPEAPEVLAALARLALEDGDLETMTAHAHKLLALAANLEGASDGSADDDRSELATALLRVAIPLLGARRSAEAQSALEGALRLYPNHPELAFYRAMALVQRGRAREGAAAFDAVDRRLSTLTGPVTPPLLGVEAEALALDARVQAALARARAGDLQESSRRLRALFAAHPGDEGVALALLEGFERAGKSAEAADLLEAAARAHPASDGLLYALANAQDRSGQRDRALVTMRKVLALQPQHSGALNYVGYTLTERGSADDLREAKELLARAVELRPDDGAVADSWGFCLLKLGRVTEAVAELRRADRISPGDPIILSHLGDALLAAGKKDDALTVFRSALRTLLPASRKGLAAETHAIDPVDRPPDPADLRVRAEIEQKLKALSP